MPLGSLHRLNNRILRLLHRLLRGREHRLQLRHLILLRVDLRLDLLDAFQGDGQLLVGLDAGLIGLVHFFHGFVCSLLRFLHLLPGLLQLIALTLLLEHRLDRLELLLNLHELLLPHFLLQLHVLHVFRKNIVELLNLLVFSGVTLPRLAQGTVNVHLDQFHVRLHLLNILEILRKLVIEILLQIRLDDLGLLFRVVE